MLNEVRREQWSHIYKPKFPDQPRLRKKSNSRKNFPFPRYTYLVKDHKIIFSDIFFF